MMPGTPNPDRPRLPPEIEQQFEQVDRKDAEAYGEIEAMMEKLDTAARRIRTQVARDPDAPIAEITGTETTFQKIADVQRTIDAPNDDDKDEDKT